MENCPKQHFVWMSYFGLHIKFGGLSLTNKKVIYNVCYFTVTGIMRNTPIEREANGLDTVYRVGCLQPGVCVYGRCWSGAGGLLGRRSSPPWSLAGLLLLRGFPANRNKYIVFVHVLLMFILSHATVPLRRYQLRYRGHRIGSNMEDEDILYTFYYE